ncbi:hypothetical protein F4679DRAFT_94150 [Xylaria curta]|nr:hypothetical protein F4679DRAFT_94150 [Xylaria curta]
MAHRSVRVAFVILLYVACISPTKTKVEPSLVSQGGAILPRSTPRRSCSQHHVRDPQRRCLGKEIPSQALFTRLLRQYRPVLSDAGTPPLIPAMIAEMACPLLHQKR